MQRRTAGQASAASSRPWYAPSLGWMDPRLTGRLMTPEELAREREVIGTIGGREIVAAWVGEHKGASTVRYLLEGMPSIVR